MLEKVKKNLSIHKFKNKWIWVIVNIQLLRQDNKEGKLLRREKMLKKLLNNQKILIK